MLICADKVHALYDYIEDYKEEETSLPEDLTSGGDNLFVFSKEHLYPLLLRE